MGKTISEGQLERLYQITPLKPLNSTKNISEKDTRFMVTGLLLVRIRKVSGKSVHNLGSLQDAG